MMSPVRPVAAVDVTQFDRATLALVERAEELEAGARQSLERAGDSVAAAGEHGARAAAHLLGATVNLGAAVHHAARGTLVDGAWRGVGHGVAGTVVGAGGVLARVGEGVGNAMAAVCHAAGRAFVKLANVLHRVVGDGRLATVKEIEGDGRERLSTTLFAAAGRQYDESGRGFAAAAASYRQAVAHALGAGVNLTAVAGYSALATCDVARALVRTGEAAALAAADGLTLLATVAVQAAEDGVQGAAALLELQARQIASWGNALARPADGDRLEVDAAVMRQVYDAELEELLRREPALGRLPAARDLLSPAGASL